MKAIIRTEKLCKTFSNQGKQVHVIRNMDLEIEAGKFTVIMGSSGSGKSTLLYALSGMDSPTLGDVFFCGEKISAYSPEELAKFRRKNCGFVFQQIHLMDTMSVLDNILAAGLLVNKNRKEVLDRCRELLEHVGIGTELLHKFPSQLSGGEAQRAGIVRSLINKPKVLFADEPTGSLNSSSGAAVLDLFTQFHETGQSIVMVTHDIKTAARGERIIYLKDGAVKAVLECGKYENSLLEERIAKIQQFLNRMGW
jgi:putative ABC transport system ATP-binding protein